MRVSWRTEAPMWLLLGAQFALAALSWPAAPEGLPADAPPEGPGDASAGRFRGLLLLPLVSLGLYLALLFAPRVDPRRDLYTPFAGGYSVLRFAVMAVMTALYGMLQVAMRGGPAGQGPVTRVVPLAIGAMFLVIGFQMGRSPGRPPLGAAPPWLLLSAPAWARANRLAGRLLIAAGTVLLVAGALGSPLLMVATVAVTVLGAAWLAFSSYRIWAQEARRDGADPV